MSAGLVDAKCMFNDVKENKYSKDCGSYIDTASNLVFEVVQVDTDSFKVKTYFNMKSIVLCPGTKPEEGCEVSLFVSTLKSMINEDWRSKCSTE